MTNCAPWHTSSFWGWINEGQNNTWAPCLNSLLCTVPSQHLFVCLLPSISISPSVYHPSISALSRAYNPLSISPCICPFSSLKEKGHIVLFPKVPGVFYPYLCFSFCPPLVHRGNQTKKVNIWTAAKDGRGVASLASASLMSRPETSSSQNSERRMTDRENCPTILMFVTWQPDWECQLKMAACPNSVCLICASSRLIWEQRF